LNDRVITAFLTLLRLKVWMMTTSELHVEVRGEIIVVIQPETGFYALYTKPSAEPQLKAQHMPLGTNEFKARACWDGHGWTARQLNVDRERQEAERFDRDLRAGTIRQVLQSRWSRISLIGASHTSALERVLRTS
jgi:hypothetical protein